MTGILIDNETGDLLVKEGALAVGDVTAQITERVLLANRGEFKELPLIGGEVTKLLGGNTSPLWPGRVKDMLNACGVAANRITVKDNIIEVA